MTSEQALDRIAHSLEQITDILNGSTPLEITREKACLPRMRGDDPKRQRVEATTNKFAPHARG
ncbi:hypothetical protein PG2093B_1386 [Bifidobacterium pseudolongum subsp. globosum]|uniref:Uncharacterized protein n=1 Tax=Bifidobacterium pseudolongum subsp. globosum TaxID=1690 RepID=A0A4Q4ZYY0_9BIFI|nr:hypothetical protein [Bifidobacterium pseudolongum]RYQ08832.1 hypothetical protein PG2093B_1386 [Bifidobacterium pseudolongum subsp. globosum]